MCNILYQRNHDILICPIHCHNFGSVAVGTILLGEIEFSFENFFLYLSIFKLKLGHPQRALGDEMIKCL